MTQNRTSLTFAALLACALFALPGSSYARDCEQAYVDCTFTCSVGWGPGATWCFRACYDARRVCKVRDTLPSVQGNAVRNAQSNTARPRKTPRLGVTGTWHRGTRADRHAAATGSIGRWDAALSARLSGDAGKACPPPAFARHREQTILNLRLAR